MTDKSWKDELIQVLCRTGLIDKDYSGRVIINLNQGGVTEVEKIQKVEDLGHE